MSPVRPRPRSLFFATRNPGKLAELRALVDPLGLAVVGISDLPPLPEVEEDGATFEENARKKALEMASASHLPCLADDSGLEVDALGGLPGVHSARYAGQGADDQANNAKLLRALAQIPEGERTARFTCVMAFADPHGAPGDLERSLRITHGHCQGLVLPSPRGSGGFGYDPLFYIPHLGASFAELSKEAKNRISHRAQALFAMQSHLLEHFHPKGQD